MLSCLTNARVVGELLDQLSSEARSTSLISCSEISRLRSIEQLWRLLAVSLDMFALSEAEADIKCSDIVHASGAGLDIMSAWSTSALGRPLLTRLVAYLLECNGVPRCASASPAVALAVGAAASVSFGVDAKQIHPTFFDVQSLATAICIVGSTRRLYDMISDEVGSNCGLLWSSV